MPEDTPKNKKQPRKTPQPNKELAWRRQQEHHKKQQQKDERATPKSGHPKATTAHQAKTCKDKREQGESQEARPERMRQ